MGLNLKGNEMNSHSLVLSEHAQRKTNYTVERDGANATSIIDNGLGRHFESKLVSISGIMRFDLLFGGDLR